MRNFPAFLIAKQKQKQGAEFLGDGYICGKALGTWGFPFGGETAS